MNATLSRLGRTALDLLYPPRCVLCGRGSAFVCESCLAGLPRATGDRCDRCWLPLGPAPYCLSCLQQPLALTQLRSVFRYEDDVRRLVHSFKFGGHSCLAEPLAAEMVALLKVWRFEPDIIVPVPLTGRRRRERGFNQAALLAQHLSDALSRPATEPLIRVRFAAAQAGSATAVERRRNVAGAFAVHRAASVAGQRLLLVDDVATTGAPLDACARAFLAAGASEIAGLTLARED